MDLVIIIKRALLLLVLVPLLLSRASVREEPIIEVPIWPECRIIEFKCKSNGYINEFLTWEIVTNAAADSFEAKIFYYGQIQYRHMYHSDPVLVWLGKLDHFGEPFARLVVDWATPVVGEYLIVIRVWNRWEDHIQIAWITIRSNNLYEIW